MRQTQPKPLLPILYLKGISTGDFAEALTALLGSTPQHRDYSDSRVTLVATQAYSSEYNASTARAADMVAASSLAKPIT